MKLYFIIVSFLLSLVSFSQDSIQKIDSLEAVNNEDRKYIDYYNLPKSYIEFDSEEYELAWSANPQPNHFIQEYLRKGELLESFERLIIFEVLTGNNSIKEIIGKKVDKIERMQLQNPSITYELFEKNDQYILDYTLYAKLPDEVSTKVVEHNVNKYKVIVDKNGLQYIIMFAFSERAYGDEVEEYKLSMKKSQIRQLNQISKFEIPIVNLEKKKEKEKEKEKPVQAVQIEAEN